MALVLEKDFPEVNFSRLIKICIVHDLGEAIGGDIPAPEQNVSCGKSSQEREDLLELMNPLPEGIRAEILSLWEEYESASTPEAKLAKALDKLETILQHNQGLNPPEFDYRFNLGYGRKCTEGNPLIEAMRKVLDEETEMRAVASKSFNR